MKKDDSIADVPPDCILAPSLDFIPSPGANPIAGLNGDRFYNRGDDSELLTADEWRRRGRKVRMAEKALAHRGVDPIGVYADWQTE